MVKNFDQFLNEGVHAKVRELTNAKVIDAINTKLLCYGVDLHYCKFEPLGFFNEISLSQLNEISIIVNTKTKNVSTYLVINIETPYIFKISIDGSSVRLDNNVILRGYLFNLGTFGHDSRDSAIIRDKKNLDKGSDEKIANKFNTFNQDQVIDLSQIEKKITSVINGLNKLNQSDLILKLSNILDGDSIKAINVKELENYQKKLYKLCSTIEDCKQAMITTRNGL